jgi:hypothetical protein
MHNEQYIMIQAITKYPVITLFEETYPESRNLIPKLNTILDPVIQDVGRNFGAKYIYVDPIGRQGELLRKYYGYSKSLNYTQSVLV